MRCCAAGRDKGIIPRDGEFGCFAGVWGDQANSFNTGQAPQDRSNAAWCQRLGPLAIMYHLTPPPLFLIKKSEWRQTGHPLDIIRVQYGAKSPDCFQWLHPLFLPLDLRDANRIKVQSDPVISVWVRVFHSTADLAAKMSKMPKGAGSTVCACQQINNWGFELFWKAQRSLGEKAVGSGLGGC